VTDPAGQPVVRQQSTYSPDGVARWMGSIAADRKGNSLLGFNASSAAVFPSIRYAGRRAGDPQSVMSADAPLIVGAGAQTGARWGDYSSLTLDPVDDCTFWYTSQYMKDGGSFNWHTYVGRLRFTDCP